MIPTCKHLLPFSLLVALPLLSSCHSDGLNREQRRVRRAAVRCYECLKAGDSRSFVNHIADADVMPEAYRREMEALIREYASNLQLQHGSLTAVSAIGDTIAGDFAHVYLQLSFADSTEEQVGVPMRRVGKEWKMQ